MSRFLRHNSLSLVFFALFLGALVFQAVAGHRVLNQEQLSHGSPEISFPRFLLSSEFATAVMENWQSEYLQFTLFILLTVWFVQRGSPESKKPGETGRESDEDQMVGEHARSDSPRLAKLTGLRRTLYENSLLLVMGAIWVASWYAQSVTGVVSYNAEQLSHREDPINWAVYIGTADFWEKTLQNWQSEFLAVGSMAVLAIYLRQRGSPESKPVGAPHEATGIDG